MEADKDAETKEAQGTAEEGSDGDKGNTDRATLFRVTRTHMSSGNRGRTKEQIAAGDKGNRAWGEDQGDREEEGEV